MGINKYFEAKKSREIKQNRAKLVNLLVQMRSFVDAMYVITSPFGRNSDPEKSEDEDYPSHVSSIREARAKEHEKVIQDFLSESKHVDAYFNKEIIDLYNDIREKWNDLGINFRMWYMTFDQRRDNQSQTGQYWTESQLKKEEYETYNSQIDDIIKIINPNYSKDLEEIDFE